jgi:uncharacterized protein YyaL (SSP411 family)
MMSNTPNHLFKENSPYLQQHAFNPVDWYPWVEEAFTKARSESKPIFLSIGYSTCHWCHVMEKESFEDNNIAEMMNEVFISIKVDREERPDIDQIYLAVCQMLTGSGGWPLTIIMTADKKPFFAGTYFPKESRTGKIGMSQLISRIRELWNSKREEILKSAEDISRSLTQAATPRIAIEIDESIFEKAFDELKRNFDSEYGGFGTAPKFPTAHHLTFLLRYWKRKENDEALNMVKKTLFEMRKGGIYDQVGFGFHRYSTDREWIVPHFEKMLYDQALLSIIYTEAYQATKNKLYKTTAEEIISYVLRDMTSVDGGFYCAEDADSEGKEGKFYVWSEHEIKSILGADSEIIIKMFGVKSSENWSDNNHNYSSYSNILHFKNGLKELSDESGLSLVEICDKINSARELLFACRDRRIHPFKDDKILTDWNSLMISALSRASSVFENRAYMLSAEKAMNFILEKMRTSQGKLLHRYRNGDSGLNANIDDYAFLIAALLDLYEVTFKTVYLKNAIVMNDALIKHFWDEKDGGFFFTSDDAEALIIRSKEIYDGAIPSGNSASILNLIRLARITGNFEYENKAYKIINVISKNLSSTPSSYTQALTALDFVYGPSYEIVICGEREKDDTKEMLKTLNENYIPNKVVVLNSEDDELKIISPFIKCQKQVQNKATVYVCTNLSCKAPVNSKSDLEKLLTQVTKIL